MRRKSAFHYCTCFHDSSEHVHGQGRCRELDSYGLPCRCPEFEHDPNTDEPEPHPDDDWDPDDPDGEGG